MSVTQKPDLSEFERASNPTKNRKCKIGSVMEVIEGTELTQLLGALASDDDVITNAAISVWLERRGHNISWQIVSVHRKNKCSCAKS